MKLLRLFNASLYQLPTPWSSKDKNKNEKMYIPIKNIKYIAQKDKDVRITLKSGEVLIEHNRNIDELLIRKNIIYDYLNYNINEDLLDDDDMNVKFYK